MQIIKDKQLTTDNWEFLADDVGLSDGNVTVSLARLSNNATELSGHKGQLGVRLYPDDSVEALADHLNNLALIELHFPDLADGRLFSHAWLLRNRYNYQGELRATGNFIPDQVFYLSRVGVNSFYPDNSEYLSATLAGLHDFSVNYQPSVN